MFNIGDKVCLAIDSSVIGIVCSISNSAEAATRYQVFHDATNIAFYFENQLMLITDSHESRKLPLQDFLGAYATQKMNINSSSTMFALNSGNIKFIPFQFRPLTRILNAERPRILIADMCELFNIEKTWITNAAQRNSDADNFIQSLGIQTFTFKDFAEMFETSFRAKQNNF